MRCTPENDHHHGEDVKDGDHKGDNHDTCQVVMIWVFKRMMIKMVRKGINNIIKY